MSIVRSSVLCDPCSNGTCSKFGCSANAGESCDCGCRARRRARVDPDLAQANRERESQAQLLVRARASVQALLAIVEPLPCWAQFCETPPAVEWAESASLRLWIPSCDEHARGGLRVRDRPHAAAIREALAALREEA